jgi:hypothetical protein
MRPRLLPGHLDCCPKDQRALVCCSSSTMRPGIDFVPLASEAAALGAYRIYDHEY